MEAFAALRHLYEHRRRPPTLAEAIRIALHAPEGLRRADGIDIPQRPSAEAETPSPSADAQEHILTVRVYDRYENASAAKTVIH